MPNKDGTPTLQEWLETVEVLSQGLDNVLASMDGIEDAVGMSLDTIESSVNDIRTVMARAIQIKNAIDNINNQVDAIKDVLAEASNG